MAGVVEPEGIAKAAGFLLSQEALAITDISLAVDAGFYCTGSWAPHVGVKCSCKLGQRAKVMGWMPLLSAS